MQNFSARQRIFKERRLRLLFFLLLVLSFLLGVLIIPFEQRAGGRIVTPFDGIWWVVTTITTVGYGDYVPISVAGKLMGIVLQLAGATMFGLLVAISSILVSRSQDEFYWNRLFERIDRLEDEIHELRKHTGYLVKQPQETETQEKPQDE